MPKIIIICTGNSVRSQMAHGFFENHLNKSAEIYSAGTNPSFVHPRAIIVMKEIGIDISKHSSNFVGDYDNIEFDFIITVCDSAKESCPFLPGKGKRIHHPFNDPSSVWGSEDEILDSFRKTRDQIKNFCLNFIKENNLK
ncbi:MAG: arsenate reductase ArsC [Bacteroidetes bacterium]|nr:arsenate reductase ArsC [Bacteroidota bacterium]